LSFLVDDVRGERSDGKGAVLTADTVLGRGTTVIDSEDGSLREYMESLRRLHGLGRRAVLPGHGPDLGDLEAVTQRYLTHREERLGQVRDALRVLGEDATARQIVEHVYTDVDETLWPHAEWSVQAQLNYLRE
jgi:glyoxylase-like metal-dependent hydrolase (beta-lactamase superfamily II)